MICRLYPSDKGTRKTFLYSGFKRLDFERALKWCIKDNVFIFNDKFFVQIDGVAMGSPLAPILADIFMNIMLETSIEKRDANSGICNVEFYDKTKNVKYIA